MFKPNIGTVNALIRITVGVTAVGLCTARLARKPWSTNSKIVLFLGAMKIAEGVVRFCPVVEAMKFRKYMNLPVMNMMKDVQSNKQEAASKQPERDHHQQTAPVAGAYDASDKKIEADIIEGVLGTKSF